MSPRTRRYDHLALGAWGEDLAADWYRRRGYELLDRNWRVARGELDLVLADGDRAIVFCEVKTRSTTRYGLPVEAVGPRKQRRIRGLALAWLSAHDRRAELLRFDVASIVGREITVIEGAF